MLTFEIVLELFHDYLELDTAYEAVPTSRGYIVLFWDECAKDYLECTHCSTPEDLGETLKDCFANLIKYQRMRTTVEWSDIKFALMEEKLKKVSAALDSHCTVKVNQSE